MKRWTILNRLGVLAASAGMIATVAAVVSNAAVTISAPQAVQINYNLAAGATSSGYTPTPNTPVTIIGANTTVNNFSATTVVLVHVPSQEIHWVGLESAPSSSVVHGASTSPGTHIVWLDYNHTVDLEVLSADEFVIHNRSSVAQAGTVKLIW